MCIVFILQSKSPTQLLKISRNKRISNNVLYVFYHDHAYTVALHESGTRKAIYWSMTVFNKELSRQYIFTEQIEPV